MTSPQASKDHVDPDVTLLMDGHMMFYDHVKCRELSN